jgi:ABC-type branched-subunit amino acid transport system ATPase component
MLDPVLLMLDEPSAGLAPLMVEVVLQKIMDIHRTGVALLLVEQNAREALKLSHRGYVLAGGQTRLAGRGQALLEDAEIARLYLGG